jgi:hypothetical protein
MRRFTSLLMVLLMLSLGLGLSHALHHATAHASPLQESASSACAGHCASAPTVPSSTQPRPPAYPTHHPDDCAVCVTLASTKTLIPVIPVCAAFVHAPADRIAPADLPAPRSATHCITRSRAPPPR